jgi:fructokinase
MGKILCVGEALIDMICSDKGRPLSQGEHFLKKAGGAPANVAAAISALGGAVDMAAKVGTDPFGQHLIEMLEEMKVGTQFVFRDKNHFTTFAFVSLMENGERDFYFNRGADAQLSIVDLAGIDLSAYSIVHFGSATAFLPGDLQKAYFHLLDEAKRQDHFISFDPNYRELLFGQDRPSFITQSWHFLKHCHFFKVSDEEAMLLTGSESVAAAAAIFQKETTAVFAITLGAKGTLLGFGGRTTLINSIPIEPVDTTGAGDAFVGALLYQLQQGGFKETAKLDETDWMRMMTNANKAGARTCMYMGAMEAFRYLNKQIFD